MLQLCPGCEKPSMVGKNLQQRYFAVDQALTPTYPPLFFSTKRGCGKRINFSGYDRTAEIPCWQRRCDSVLQVDAGPLLSL